MAIINGNSAICQSSDALLGFADCAPRLEQPVGVLFMDSTLSFDTTSYATNALYLAALQTATLASGTSRIRPLPIKVGASFSDSADPTIVNGMYGGAFSVINGKPIMTIELPKNAFITRQELYKLNNSQTLSCQIFDKANRLMGRGKASAFKGFKIDAVEIMKYETPAFTTDAPQKIRIHFSDEDMFVKDLYFYQFDRDAASNVYPAENLFAIKKVELESVSASATAVVVRARIAGSRQSMGVNYETGMELPAAWVFTKASDGTAQTISGVTYTAATESFSLAGSGLVTGYLNLVTASELAALTPPVGAAATGGFESTPILITIA